MSASPRTPMDAHDDIPGGTTATSSAASLRQAVLKQEAFLARHQEEWNEFEAWLVARGDSPRQARASQNRWQGLRDEDVPARYRRLCQQLAIARSRGYSPLVVERLQSLTQRGHAVFYRAPPPLWRRALMFFLADFPRLVRATRGCLLAAALLFAVPLVGAFVAVQVSPELIYTVMSPVETAEMEQMYDPADPNRKLGRESGDDVMMFGVYIMNNVSIALRTFASGLIFALGSVYVLIMNGLIIGGVAGHLQGVGHGDPFWRFVAGHSGPELIAIVLAGAAGLQLGLALVAPGRRRRVDALIEAGKIGAKLCLGIFAMLLFAAFVEAFWSSIGWIPALVKYAVGATLWTSILLWLALGGRGGSADAPPRSDA
ncbi:MAG: stage II sporulation protein M [Pseudomonadota bacterium]